MKPREPHIATAAQLARGYCLECARPLPLPQLWCKGEHWTSEARVPRGVYLTDALRADPDTALLLRLFGVEGVE